jgi:hypothetical protein
MTGRLSASSTIAGDSTEGSFIAAVLMSYTESSNQVQRHVGGLEVKVDNLKAMSEKQTDDQKASIESLTKLISDTAKNQEAKQEADHRETVEMYAGLSERLFEAQKENREHFFLIQEGVSETDAFTRSAFASTVVPAVLICGLGGQLVVAGVSFGWFDCAVLSSDLAKDLARVFSGLVVTFGTTSTIAFNTFKHFEAARTKKRAMEQKSKEETYRREEALHIKQQAEYRKKFEKRAGDK